MDGDDGVFAPDGSFIALPALDDEPFEKLWQEKVFDLLLKRGKIDQSLRAVASAPRPPATRRGRRGRRGRRRS